MINTAVFYFITTGILAIAAILAYLIQRARYLREIEPDLELKWPKVFRDIDLGSTLDGWWSFFIDIEVENLSKNHAEDLEYEVALSIFPQRERPQCSSVKIRDWVPMHPREVLAGRKTTIPVYIGKNYAIELERAERLKGGHIKEAGFRAAIIISYHSRRELLLWFLLPWRAGRPKYVRRIFGAWWFDYDEMEMRYCVRWWDHPEVPQHIQQNVSSRKDGW